MGNEQRESTDSDLPRAIGRPAAAAFALAGYRRLEQFAGVSESELLRLHGVGPKAIQVLRAALAEKGLAFSDGDSDET